MDDAALLSRASGGDEAAFSQLFARYQRQIYLYAERVSGCGSGDDIVQETFLAVLRPSGRFDPAKGTVPGYLFGIARHHVIKRLARQGVTLAEPPDTAAAVVLVTVSRLLAVVVTLPLVNVKVLTEIAELSDTPPLVLLIVTAPKF